MNKLRIFIVAGCRPNFVKLGPLLHQMRARPLFEPVLVHTGQHYDAKLSDVFFRDLEIPAPDVLLGVGSGTHAAQTARVMADLEGVLRERAPDLVIVVGDVNSTVAAALTSVKLGFPVAHVEAGLRSFDREMPEEVNRVVTDAISDLLFATERDAIGNLAREGIPAEKVFLVGNLMADALRESMDRIRNSGVVTRLGLEPKRYALLTLHRPDNVDDPAHAAPILEGLRRIAAPIVFPVHPRTVDRFKAGGVWKELQAIPRLVLTEPQGYVDFLKLVKKSAVVLTDSGGLQEEATLLGVPCLTLRANTERPVTVVEGTNTLVGRDPELIARAAHEALDGYGRRGRIPELWDGRTAGRILDVIEGSARRIRGLYPELRRRTACEQLAATA